MVNYIIKKGQRNKDIVYAMIMYKMKKLTSNGVRRFNNAHENVAAP